MKHIVRIFFINILVGSQLTYANGQDGKISGIIIDVSTGAPVAGQSVIYFGTTYGQKTDELGHFELEDLPLKKCEVNIDGGQDYYTLSLRNIPLSKKERAVDLDTVYMINYGFNTQDNRLHCYRFENKYYSYSFVDGLERFIQGFMGVVDFSDPNESCPQALSIADEESNHSFIDNRYPGGREALRHHIARSAWFPPEAAENSQSGFSVSSISLTHLGIIDNISIHHSLGEVIDNAVEEILQSTEGQWIADKTISENQSIYFQIIFTYEKSGKEERIYLAGDSILQEVIVVPLRYEPPKYQTSQALYKSLQKDLEKEKYTKALEVLEVCLSRDPFNIHYHELLAMCYEGIGNEAKKISVENRLQDAEKKGIIALLDRPEVFGNIRIVKEIKNGNFSITELLRDSTLLYTGKLKSISPEKKHGKFYFYNSSGNISAMGQYEDDIPVGIWTYFNKDQEAIFAANYTKTLNFILQEDTAEYNRDPFYIVEIMPKFNGGDPAIEFEKYILQSIIYPEYPKKKVISGRVIVQFMVDYTGKVRNPQIVRGVHTDLNVEALRVVSESPAWTPGIQRNSPADVLFTFPINFSMEEASAHFSDKGDFETIDSEDNRGGTFDIFYFGGYAELDSPPLFEGKDPGNFRYHIANTLQYPEKAAENGIKGRVVVKFAVDKDGSVGDISIVESADPELNKEAIRVVKSSPKWISAKKDGKNVVCYLRFPINFVL